MMIEKHHIKPGQIWNMDEKGFRIGILNKSKRIVPISQLQNECKGQLQDGSTEYITLIAAVSALGLKMAPSIIYCSESGDLQDKWLESFDSKTQKAFWAASPKGWTSDALGSAWLDRFIKETESNADYGLETRLLILDGHSSHANLEFIKKAIAANIWVVIFPPHSTHRLQPLDVGIFSPLSAAYSKELNLYTHNSRSFSRVTKGIFWQLFWAAWEVSVRPAVIQSAFQKTGIYPHNPSIVLNTLRILPKEEPLEEQGYLPVVKTTRDIRDLAKKVYKCPEKHIDYLLKCLEALSIDNECIHHENHHLKAVILGERKQRKTGKALGLVNGDGDKFAQFYSPTKYQARVEALQQKEALIEQEKQQKQDERTQAKEMRELKAHIRREAIAARKQAAKEKRENNEREKMARKRARERARATKIAQKLSKRPPRSMPITQIRDAPLSAVEVVEERVQTRIEAQTRSGSRQKLPAKFLD